MESNIESLVRDIKLVCVGFYCKFKPLIDENNDDISELESYALFELSKILRNTPDKETKYYKSAINNRLYDLIRRYWRGTRKSEKSIKVFKVPLPTSEPGEDDPDKNNFWTYTNYSIDGYEAIYQNDDWNLIEQNLEKLSSNERRLVNYFHEGFTYKETGEKLNVTKSRVSQLKFKIAKKIASTRRCNKQKNLSFREQQVCQLTAEGLELSEISQMLNIAYPTTITYYRNAKDKLGFKTGVGAIGAIGAIKKQKKIDSDYIFPQIRLKINTILNEIFYMIKISTGEQRILNCVLEDNSVEEIAQKLNISPNTVNHHIRSIKKKFGVNTFAGIAIKARELGYDNTYKVKPYDFGHLKNKINEAIEKVLTAAENGN